MRAGNGALPEAGGAPEPGVGLACDCRWDPGVKLHNRAS